MVILLCSLVTDCQYHDTVMEMLSEAWEILILTKFFFSVKLFYVCTVLIPWLL